MTMAIIRRTNLPVDFIAGLKDSAPFFRPDLIQESEDSNLDVVAVVSVLRDKVEAHGRTALDIISGINERDLFCLYEAILDIMTIKRFLDQVNRAHTHTVLLCLLCFFLLMIGHPRQTVFVYLRSVLA